MKNKIFLLLAFLFYTVAFGQPNEKLKSGIYLSAEAFENGHLTYEIDCSSEKHKIKPNTHREGKTFQVIHDKQKIHLNKEEVYGYKDCKGRDFRFDRNESYKIIYPGLLILYSNYVDDEEDDIGLIRQKKSYYFSKNLGSKIIPLSISSLKKAFPDNHEFHDLLDTNFSSNKTITAYDDFHDTYKVNWLLGISKEGIINMEKEIAEIIKKIQNGINRKDLNSLNGYFSDKAKVYKQGLVIESWAHYRDDHLKTEIEEIQDMIFSIEVEDSFFTKQMALVRGNFDINGKINKQKINSFGLITLSMHIEDNMWKIIHLQFSRKDNKTVIKPFPHGAENDNKPKLKSPKKTAMGNAGDAHIHIDYSSPSVRGRTIWGGLVDYDKVWATGAHRATTINFSEDVEINKIKVPAGKYGFFTIPGEKEWTLIINNKWDQHMSDDYDTSLDVVRIKVKPEKLPENQEALTYTVNKKNNSTSEVTMAWEKLKVSFEVKAL